MQPRDLPSYQIFSHAEATEDASELRQLIQNALDERKSSFWMPSKPSSEARQRKTRDFRKESYLYRKAAFADGRQLRTRIAHLVRTLNWRAAESLHSKAYKGIVWSLFCVQINRDKRYCDIPVSASWLIKIDEKVKPAVQCSTRSFHSSIGEQALSYVTDGRHFCTERAV